MHKFFTLQSEKAGGGWPPAKGFARRLGFAKNAKNAKHHSTRFSFLGGKQLVE
jgi:hypothetical protein